ncbi:MAG: hypothetical protein O3A53_18710 [Acidobacteria bacterium]|nr:hypothetical protein [Acidobacteriota bacterium]
MVSSSAGQIAGILPSNTPLGAGTMTVRFNGSVAATGDVNVVAHSFGIFTINQQGIGPAVATDPLAGAAVYSTINSAAPGDFIDIWGTGLGAVGYPDDGPTQPGTLAYDVKVYISGQEQAVEYADRSGCCTAVDLVRVKAPNIIGCFLPVVVVVNGIPSNYASISIDPSGTACTADPTFGGPDFSQLQSGGTVDIGSIFFTRSRISIDIDVVGPQATFDQTTDAAGASYARVTLPDANAVRAFAPQGINQIGACTVFRFTGESAQYPQLVAPVPLDAGPQLSLDGPGGAEVMTKNGPGSYAASFVPDFPFLNPEGQDQFPVFPTYFEPGLTTVMAPGGADVGAHSASIVVPQDFEWLNKPAANAVINRNNGFPVNYNATGYDYVNIFGYSATMVGQDTIGAGFFCAASAAAGSFTIPAAVLQSLPQSQLTQGFPLGFLTVGGYVTDTFNSADLDVRTIVYADSSVVTVNYN